MPFHELEPFETATARYVWTGLGGPGFFEVRVKGKARVFTSGITLIRDSHYSGGLAIDVMGWTGSLKVPPEYNPYDVTGNFSGKFEKEILIVGTGKAKYIPVKEHHYESEEAYVNLLSSPVE